MSKELNKAPVEQAGGDERAVDGKPRATKCPDCGEGDLMPGDLCACGYETDPAAGYACSECDGSGDGYVGEVCRECDGSGWFVTPEQARAALAQPSPAQAEQAEAERPEFDESEREDMARIAFETAMANGISLDSFTFLSNSLAERYERIVGELRAVIAQLRQHKNDYMDSGQQTYRALQNEIREREAEIARLDGLVSGRTAERDAALAEVKRIKTISDNYYALCVERQQQLDAALAMVSGLRSLLNPILCYVENDIERMRGDRDKSDNKETYDLAISLAMKRLKAAQHAVFTTEPGCNTAVELASHITAQAQHSVPDVCDGKEQDAFEEWARKEGLDTSCHPMHWLFLDAKTNSARQGWKAALRYVRSQLAAAPGKEVGHE
ncbi:hypothetical protein ACM751_16235 [Pseudomonas aeruginosa]